MDYYRILEVTEQADEEQIKQAYRRLAKKYHPDLNPDNLDAEEKFKNIVKAYEILGDTIKRKAYDSKRRQPVIYGNPERSKPKNSSPKSNNFKTNNSKANNSGNINGRHNKEEHSKVGHREVGYTETEHWKVKYTKAEPDKAKHDEATSGNPKPDMHQNNATGVKESQSDFTKNLEQYFGFTFEEGKKVAKEQGSQKEQEDSLDLTEIFKMFMKME